MSFASSRRVGLVLVALSLAMLAARFVRLDLAAFINDEPRFLEAARAQVLTGHWLAVSPFPGTQGVRYGPTVFWFYGLVGLLWSDHPRAAIAAMCAAVSLAQLGLVVVLARVFGGGPALFATLLAFVASSPYQFFWSRLAWDQTVDACSAAAVAVVALSARPDWRLGLALGGLTGLALSSHLMVLPFVGALCLALAWEAWRDAAGRARWVGFTSAAAATALLVNLPYLRSLAGAPPGELRPVPLEGATVGAYALEPARVATLWRIEYFFDADWADFQGWLGGYAGLWRGGSLATVLLAGASLCGLVAALRSPDPRARRLGRLGLLTWLLAPPILATRTVFHHPHYQFGTWWLVAVGLAAALVRLHARSPVAGRVAAAAVWLLAALQSAFIAAWLGYVDERVGTRGVHYGTPVGHQEAVMRELCLRPEARLVLRNETELFRRPLVYWSQVLPACQAKEVIVCGAGARAEPLVCPEPGAGGRRVRLGYARERGGALRLEPEE